MNIHPQQYIYKYRSGTIKIESICNKLYCIIEHRSFCGYTRNKRNVRRHINTLWTKTFLFVYFFLRTALHCTYVV